MTAHNGLMHHHSPTPSPLLPLGYAFVLLPAARTIIPERRLLKTALRAQFRPASVGEDMNESPRSSSELLKHTLLTLQQEARLSRKLRLSRVVRALVESNMPLPQELSEPGAVEAVLEDGERARRLLIKSNMRLVVHICQWHMGRGLSFADLVEEGTFGLMKAVDKYDPDRGFRFSTCATWWIRSSISRAIADKSRIVRLPAHIHEGVTSLMHTTRMLEREKGGGKPSTQEISDRLALPLPHVQLLLELNRVPQSAESSVESARGMSAGSVVDLQVKDKLRSSESDPSVSIGEADDFLQPLRQEMRRVLTPRETAILEMRFGLRGGEGADDSKTARAPMTLKRIASIFNVTRERIRQIEGRALSKLRLTGKSFGSDVLDLGLGSESIAFGQYKQEVRRARANAIDKERMAVYSGDLRDARIEPI